MPQRYVNEHQSRLIVHGKYGVSLNLFNVSIIHITHRGREIVTKKFKHSQLADADLVVDAVYEAGAATNLKSEVLSKLLPVGNAGGFRYVGSGAAIKLVVLTSNETVGVWPDYLNPETGLLSYFGDNRASGDLHSTKGNRILRDCFSTIHEGPEARLKIPIFLYFTKHGSGRDWCFRGLLVPGGQGVAKDDELIAVWRSSDQGERFQNYKATFTVLDVPSVSRDWIKQIFLGERDSTHAPRSYLDWLKTGRYRPLEAPSVKKFRTRQEQLPDKREDQLLLDHLVSRFVNHPHQFEYVALEIWKLISKEPVSAKVTKKTGDGGYDAIGNIHIGSKSDLLPLDFKLEAKCYSKNTSVGVNGTSRLISRIGKHQFGVLVTTSFVGETAYKEIREDNHKIVIISGIDIVRALKANGLFSSELLDDWLTGIPMNRRDG